MAQSNLVIKAGSRAYDLLKTSDLQPEMIAGVAAAAGGPKWFTTYGLVRYIIDELTNDDIQRFYIGSSVGSWQMAAACTQSPGLALDRLRESYANHIYTEKADAQEISDACASMIEHMVDDQTDHILNNQSKKLYIVTSRGKGLASSENKIALSLGLGSAAIAHSIKRSWLNNFMSRDLFTNSEGIPFNSLIDDLTTRLHSLNSSNLIDSMRASGAIPLLMRAIKISGLEGTYWDGGIVDYHMAFPYDRKDGKVVLLPHFSPYVLAGWFDKHLPYIRHADKELMSDVILIHPSENYISQLPRKQISTLKDFDYYGMDQNARISYWNQISEMSMTLGDELRNRINDGSLKEVVEPY